MTTQSSTFIQHKVAAEALIAEAELAWKCLDGADVPELRQSLKNAINAVRASLGVVDIVDRLRRCDPFVADGDSSDLFCFFCGADQEGVVLKLSAGDGPVPLGADDHGDGCIWKQAGGRHELDESGQFLTLSS